MISVLSEKLGGIRPADLPIIDAHCHLGLWAAFHGPRDTPEALLVHMDALGIDTAVISAHAAIGPDFILGNSLVIDALEKYPDRFLGYLTLNPNYPEDMERELSKRLTLPGIVGIKLHPDFHRTTVDHVGYAPAYKAACENRLPVLIHTWGVQDVLAAGRMAQLYKDAAIIIGHAGGSDIRAMEAAVETAEKNGNVYLDLTLSQVYQSNVEWLVSRVGSKKMLFGTDMPFYDAGISIGRIALAELDDHGKYDILGGNMLRILTGRKKGAL